MKPRPPKIVVKKLWISTPRVTGQVDVDIHGIIRFTPLVWQKFKGQPIANLRNWLFDTLGQDIEIRRLN